MSPETTGPNRPDARKSADRRIFREIDAKVAIASDMWRTSMILPIPLATDTPEMIEVEERVLVGILERAHKIMPSPFARYDEYLILGEVYEQIPQEDVDRRTEIRGELDRFKKTRDFEFAELITLGVPKLITRRRLLRDLQEELGEPNPNGVYEDPGVFTKLQGLGFSKDQITRVIMGAYSVNVFVTEEAYKDKYDTDQPNTNGVHLGASLNHISVIKDYLADYLRSGQISPDHLDGTILNTVLHEEFHGFADAFTYRGNDYFTQLQKVLRNQMKFILTAINDGDLQLVDALLGQAKRLLRKIPSSSVEELVAEMASTNERDGVPRSTFAVHNGKKKPFLETMESHDALASIDVRRSTGSLIDNELLRERIKTIYELVDEQIPERRGDVDILFTVIPANKVTHIWKTVVRWIWERDNQVTR